MGIIRQLSKLIVVVIACLVVSVSSPEAARAVSISFATPSNSTTGGQPVSAEVTFVTGFDTLTIHLENLEANPTSVVQNLSGLSFKLTTGQTSGTLTSSAALERTIGGGGSFTDGATVSTGWSLSTQSSKFSLNVLGTAIGPAHTLIGPPGGATYSHANGSIAGNKPHNPFLAGVATFVLQIPGVTPASSVLTPTFLFGTTPGSNTISGVPEPSTWVLAVTALVGLLGWRYRRLGFAGIRT